MADEDLSASRDYYGRFSVFGTLSQPINYNVRLRTVISKPDSGIQCRPR